MWGLDGDSPEGFQKEEAVRRRRPRVEILLAGSDVGWNPVGLMGLDGSGIVQEFCIGSVVIETRGLFTEWLYRDCLFPYSVFNVRDKFTERFLRQ